MLKTISQILSTHPIFKIIKI